MIRKLYSLVNTLTLKKWNVRTSRLSRARRKKREEIYIRSSDYREVVNRIGVHSIQIACILYISLNRFVKIRCVTKKRNEVCNGSFTKLFVVRLCGIFCTLYSQSKIALRCYNKIILNNNLQILVYKTAMCASRHGGA